MNNLAINMKSKESFQKCTKQKIERVKDIEFRPASVILSAVLIYYFSIDFIAVKRN